MSNCVEPELHRAPAAASVYGSSLALTHSLLISTLGCIEYYLHVLLILLSFTLQHICIHDPLYTFARVTEA